MGRYLDFVNPKTILSRTTNFGIATYEVVKKMKEDGLIKGDEDGTELAERPDEMNMNEARALPRVPESIASQDSPKGASKT